MQDRAGMTSSFRGTLSGMKPPAARNDPATPAMDGRLFLTGNALDRGAVQLLASARRLARQVREAGAKAGLNPAQTDVLLEIHHAPASGVSTLRKSLGLPVPTMARLLSELTERGLVHRSATGGDGRTRAVTLSDAGEAVVADLLDALRALTTDAFRKAGEPSVAGALRLAHALEQAGDART